jgi:hypothetical protein
MSSLSKDQLTSGLSAVGNIEHVIVLMFENRSFDHILGAMPGVDGVLDAQGNVLPDLYNTMDPTTEPGDDNPTTPPTPVVPFLNPDPPLPPRINWSPMTSRMNSATACCRISLVPVPRA